jgi:hypothetical protein
MLLMARYKECEGLKTELYRGSPIQLGSAGSLPMFCRHLLGQSKGWNFQMQPLQPGLVGERAVSNDAF